MRIPPPLLSFSFGGDDKNFQGVSLHKTNRETSAATTMSHRECDLYERKRQLRLLKILLRSWRLSPHTENGENKGREKERMTDEIRELTRHIFCWLQEKGNNSSIATDWHWARRSKCQRLFPVIFTRVNGVVHIWSEKIKHRIVNKKN